jgi:predicted dehydrogenase
VIRAGVVGLGVMGKNHARVIGQLKDVSLVGLFDPLLIGAEFNGLKVCKSIDEFADLKLDYCVIAVPTAFHFDAAMKLASIGINCLIEKPLASSSEQAREIEREFKSRKLLGAVGHVERYNPALLELKRKIELGLVGDVIQVSTRRTGPFPGRISDVGVVKDLASHDIDLTRWITGSEYDQVFAQTRSLSGRAHEDLLVSMGSLKNRIVFNHMINWLSPTKERTTSVLGTKGMLIADSLNVDLSFYENGNVRGTWNEIAMFKGVSEGDSTKFALERNEPLVTEHRNFINRLSGDEAAAIVSLSDGVAVLAVIEKILEVA